MKKSRDELDDRMSGKVPLEVGTRGTIGSLLKREIEYFTRLEENRINDSGGGRLSWPFSMASWRRRRRKKRPAGICSVVEVVETEQLNEVRGFSYLNLRRHSDRYDV